MFDRLHAAYVQHEATFELRIQVWPFMALIWAGVAAAIFTSAARLIRIFSHDLPQDEGAPSFHE
jgi:C4-dicarboxylate transporter, DctQ subunit